MTEASVLDVHELVISNHSFGPTEINQICKTISEDYSQLGVLKDAVKEIRAIIEEAEGAQGEPDFIPLKDFMNKKNRKRSRAFLTG